MKLAVTLFAAMLPSVIEGACDRELIMENLDATPDLQPHSALDLRVDNYVLRWTAKMSNVGTGAFEYDDGDQVVKDGNREICRQATKPIDEIFSMYTEYGVKVAESTKTVWCLMDSEGGTDNDAVFSGALCHLNKMGISPRGVDDYSVGTQGQQINTRGWESGSYVLATKLEVDNSVQRLKSNDYAYVKIYLDGEGPWKRVYVTDRCEGLEDGPCLPKLWEEFRVANENRSEAEE